MPADLDTGVEVLTVDEQDRLYFAETRLKFDRWGMPIYRPGCQADRNHMGWVPGVIYRIWCGEHEVLGYTVDGNVVVTDGDRTWTHFTRLHRHDRIVGLSGLGRRLARRSNR